MKKVSIGVSDLAKSLTYWQNLLGMTLYEQTEAKALLGYDSDKCKLELIHLGHPVDHATAFGRIAFSCPSKQLPVIESSVKTAGHTILTPLVSLDTPGKATVEVVILADPVGYSYTCMTNLRSGILFSEEHESIATQESAAGRVVLFSSLSQPPTFKLLYFHAPPKKKNA